MVSDGMRKEVFGMKWLVICLLFFLVGCGAADETPEDPRSVFEYTGAERITVTDDATLTLQENLARWYNVNLAEELEPGFMDAYDQILFFSDGVMGSLECCGRWELPIYHGESEKGVGHDPNSAFPVGGEGNHSVLYLPADFGLEVGDLVTIHILNASLDYEIIAVRRALDVTAAPGMDYCSLIGKDGIQYLAVRVENNP